jgi:hypothetical protein
MSREAISDNFGTSKKTMNLFTAMPGFQKGRGKNVAAMKHTVSSLQSCNTMFQK